jgi:signal transduction histidine kinase
MFTKRLVVLAVTTLISILAIGWISERSTRVVAESVDSLDHTRSVLLQVDHFRSSLSAAESSARGYLITGVPVFSTSLERAIQSMRLSSVQLRKLALPDESQRTSLVALDALMASRIDVFLAQLSLKGGFAAQSRMDDSVVKGTEITREMDEILEDIRSAELRHFQLQVSNTEAARRFAIYGPRVMGGISLVMLALLLVQVAATLSQAQAMRDRLKSTALEEHVGREQAQEASLMKEQLLATVSHELRTPLTSIIGWCGLLNDEKSRATLLDEGLASIAQAARVQSQLVDDLLDASRVIAGRLQLYIAECNSEEVIQHAIASVAPSAQTKGITIKRSVNGSPRRLVADATRLEQVVWNLLSNAIKFTPPNGLIEVVLHYTDSQLGITVTDNGEGIAPDLLPYIFDRFRQGKASGSRSGGLGLGLSIVKSLVDLHGGTVRATSAGFGTGATFVVELPLAGVAAAELRMAS